MAAGATHGRASSPTDSPQRRTYARRDCPSKKHGVGLPEVREQGRFSRAWERSADAAWKDGAEIAPRTHLTTEGQILEFEPHMPLLVRRSPLETLAESEFRSRPVPAVAEGTPGFPAKRERKKLVWFGAILWLDMVRTGADLPYGRIGGGCRGLIAAMRRTADLDAES